ncbi:MAG: flippase-like domain-containing protein [Gemmatimonadetes bacterium]|nr:flippase-like domain-containing protein [Gemmatimonadota bacterium]
MTVAEAVGGPEEGAASPAGPPSSGRPGRRLLLRAVQLALTALVTWWILDRVGLTLDALSGVDLAAWRPSWTLLLLSCVALALGYVASGLIWGRMVRDLGGPRLAPLDAVSVYMVANLGRYVPGKLWQIAGLAVLARRRGVPAAVATAAAVAGQAVALAGATVVGFGAIVAGPPPLRRFTPWVAAGVVLVVALVAVPALSRRSARVWFRLTRTDLPEGVEPGGADGLRWLALYTLNWGLYALAFWLLVRSFGLPGSPLVVAPAFAAAYVLGYAVLFAPAGIGVREGFLVALLAPVMGTVPAGVLAGLARLWTTGVELLPAAAFWGRELAGKGRTDDG